MTKNLRYSYEAANRRKSSLLSIAVILFAAVWLARLGWSARGFISQVDLRGVLQQFDALNDTLNSNSVLIFNDQAAVGMGDFWGTPLKYIFGHDVIVLRDGDILDRDELAEMIDLWQNNGRTVYWFGEAEWLDEAGFSYQERTEMIASQRLESSYEHKPQAVIPVDWTFQIAVIEGR